MARIISTAAEPDIAEGAVLELGRERTGAEQPARRVDLLGAAEPYRARDVLPAFSRFPSDRLLGARVEERGAARG